MSVPACLLGLLDKAKAYRLLQENHPQAVEDVDYINYGEKPPVMDFEDYEIRIQEAFRFDAEDTLIFRLNLHNKSDADIYYQPESFAVRVGERLYHSSISDASGIMPAQSESPAYFAITGTPTGGRNDISLKNEFTVLLTRIDDGADARADDSRGPEETSGFSK